MPGSGIPLGALFRSGLSAADSTLGSYLTVSEMFEEERNRKRELAFKADSYRNDAIIAEYEADHARAMASIRAKEIVRGFRRQNGAMRAGMAVSGVVISDGSAVDALMDRAAEAGRAKELAEYQGEMQAWRHENDAARAHSQRRFTESQSRTSFASRYRQAKTVWTEANKMKDVWSNLADLL